MAWINITDEDVIDEITPAENAALRNIQGAVDKLPRILARVVKKFRGAIQAGGQTLGDDGTIPESVEDDVVAYARWRFLTSIPQAKAMQTEERKLAYTEAIKVLEALRDGELNVETADEEDPVPTGGTFGGQVRIPMRTDNVQE